MEQEIRRSRYIAQMEQAVCNEIKQYERKQERPAAKWRLRQLLTLVGLLH